MSSSSCTVLSQHLADEYTFICARLWGLHWRLLALRLSCIRPEQKMKRKERSHGTIIIIIIIITQRPPAKMGIPWQFLSRLVFLSSGFSTVCAGPFCYELSSPVQLIFVLLLHGLTDVELGGLAVSEAEILYFVAVARDGCACRPQQRHGRQ